jgi:hypothetical protein
MILEAILLTVAKISANGDAKLPVAVLPQMQVDTGPDDGICIINPATKFQVWLTGHIDYGLCTYGCKSYQGKNSPTSYMLHVV